MRDGGYEIVLYIVCALQFSSHVIDDVTQIPEFTAVDVVYPGIKLPGCYLFCSSAYVIYRVPDGGHIKASCQRDYSDQGETDQNGETDVSEQPSVDQPERTYQPDRGYITVVAFQHLCYGQNMLT